MTSDLSALSAFGYDAKILYNAALLEYIGFEKKGTLSEKLLLLDNPNVLGEVRFSGASADSIFGKGVLLLLMFRAKSDTGLAVISFDSFSFTANVDSTERFPVLNSGKVTINPIVTSVNDSDDFFQADNSEFYPYPNPFNGYLTIKFNVPASTMVEITIYDVLGRKVRTLLNEMHGVGDYTTRWDGTSDLNVPVSSGIYFCLIRGAGQNKNHKIFYIK